MPSESLRAKAQRAFEKVSHATKLRGTAFPMGIQGHNPAVPLSQPLGLGQWDTSDLDAQGKPRVR